MNAIIPFKKHIAFLRAINVGGHNVKMDVLRGVNTVWKLAEKYA